MEQIVKVTWIDAQRLELGVIQESELPDIKPIPCDIVGFLVHEDEERIIVAQEKWDKLGLDLEQTGVKYVHVIPKVSILKIIRLKEDEDCEKDFMEMMDWKADVLKKLIKIEEELGEKTTITMDYTVYLKRLLKLIEDASLEKGGKKNG